ncbi:MAG: hypothetical protein KF680_08825 [Cryobacterium sp.]|nr:hypothetical protein [Cryobacterium sp.]
MKITPILLAIGLALSSALMPASLVVGEESAPAVAGAPLSLAIVAPIAVPPGDEGMLDATTLERYTTPGGVLAAQLGQLGGRPVTLAIDPMILASIRALGTSVPKAAHEWLLRLAGLTNSSFALQWADANPALAIQAGREVLAVPHIRLDASLFAAEGTEIAGGESGDPVMPALPSQAELVAWAHSLGPIAWPGDQTLGTDDLEALAAAGLESVIVGSSNVTATSSVPHVDLGPVNGIVSDDVVSSLLRSTIAAQTDESWSLAFEALRHALHDRAAGSAAPVVATLARPAQSVPQRLSQTLDALAQLPELRLVPLDRVLEQPTTGATYTHDDVTDERAATIAQLLSAEEDVRVFSSALDDPTGLLSSRRAKLLALLSTGWSADSSLWHSAAEQFLTDCRGILGAVTIQDSSTINLLADSGPFPVTVRNDLAHAVTVYVTVRPDRPILRVLDGRVELKIPANSQAKAMVPVQTVANGQVSSIVSLSSVDRTPISTPVRVALNVQAGWETTATVVVIAAIGLMLLAGIWRTVRARRRLLATASVATASTTIVHDTDASSPSDRTNTTGSDS